MRDILKSNFVRNAFIILVLISLALGFSKSYTSYNIDNLDFALSLGLDVSDTDESKLKVTFEFTKSSIYSPESNGNEDVKPIINTVEASSIDSAINLMNAHLGKEVKLSHCKLIIFSEQVAKKGISKEIYTLMNNVQIRPSTNIIVTKSDALSYIENLNPTIENHITQYYEAFPESR